MGSKVTIIISINNINELTSPPKDYYKEYSKCRIAHCMHNEDVSRQEYACSHKTIVWK